MQAIVTPPAKCSTVRGIFKTSSRPWNYMVTFQTDTRAASLAFLAITPKHKRPEPRQRLVEPLLAASTTSRLPHAK